MLNGVVDKTKTFLEQLWDKATNTESMQKSRANIKKQLDEQKANRANAVDTIADGAKTIQAAKEANAKIDGTPTSSKPKGISKGATVGGKGQKFGSSFSYNADLSLEDVAKNKANHAKYVNYLSQKKIEAEMRGNFDEAKRLEVLLDKLGSSSASKVVTNQNNVKMNSPSDVHGMTTDQYLKRVVPNDESRNIFKQRLSNRAKAVYNTILTSKTIETPKGDYVVVLGDKHTVGEEPMYLRANSREELAAMYTQLLIKLSTHENDAAEFISSQDEEIQNVLVDQIKPEYLPPSIRPYGWQSAMRNDTVKGMTFLNNLED
jgi:hypothetical protein